MSYLMMTSEANKAAINAKLEVRIDLAKEHMNESGESLEKLGWYIKEQKEVGENLWIACIDAIYEDTE